jgi:hypothetical protein
LQRRVHGQLGQPTAFQVGHNATTACRCGFEQDLRSWFIVGARPLWSQLDRARIVWGAPMANLTVNTNTTPL